MIALDTLSRLKGIETLNGVHLTTHLATLDTLSRLKGIETFLELFTKLAVCVSLDTLSRLKGIETAKAYQTIRDELSAFGYAFPFEGN